MAATVLALHRAPGIRFGPGHVAQALAAQVEHGRVLVLQARWSDSSGSAAYRAVASNLRTAIRAVADSGVDVSEVVPEDEDSLAALLRTGARRVITEGADGRRFTHRFLMLDRSSQGVVVLLSVGTGHKLDEQLNQPAVDWVCDKLLVLEPALVFTADISRLGRAAGDKLTAALDQVQARRGSVHFGSGTVPIQPWSSALAAQVRLLLMTAQMEAEAITQRTSSGARTRAESIRIGPDLRWQWPTASVLPPGLDCAHMSAPGGGLRGKAWAFLDSPATRPPDTAIITGGSRVLGPGGSRVDQVALVRWFLAHYGSPGWTQRTCAAYLCAHGYSTPGLRRQRQDPASVWRIRDRNTDKICRTILGHLDFYETGKLLLRPPHGQDPVELVGIFPPDGPWADPEDFLRIRATLTQRAERTAPGTRAAAGLLVRYNGAAAVLRSDHHGDGVRYRISDPVPRRAGRRNNIRDLLDGRDLVELCAALLVAAGEGVERAVDPARQADHVQTLARLSAATADAARLEEAQRLRLAELDPATRTLTGAALDAVQTAFNTDAPRLATAQEDVERACRTLEVLERRAPDGAGLRVQDALDLVARLRDPYAPEVRTLLRTAVHDLRIEDTTVPAPCGTRATLRTISASLLLRDEHGATWSSRTSITRLEGTWPGYVDKLVSVLDGMRRGIHPRYALGALWRQPAPLLAVMLHGHSGPFPFPDPTMEPRLLALAMAVCFPETKEGGRCDYDGAPGGLPVLAGEPLSDADLRRVSRGRREPAALLFRIRGAFGYLDRPQEYLLRPNDTVARLYPQAGAGNGVVVCTPTLAAAAIRRAPKDWSEASQGVRLRPCGCGSLLRALDRRREVDTSICRNCRRDRSAVSWLAV